MKSKMILGLAAVLASAGLAMAQCGSSTKTASACTQEKKAACGDKTEATASADHAVVTASYQNAPSGMPKAPAMAAGSMDIVDTAVTAGQFTTLAAALKAAGLIETLKGKGPFTVFAPTDEAFKALPRGTVETLLKPENKDKLVAVLTYHVVPGKVTADQVVKLTSADTVNGQRVAIVAKDGKVTIDSATVAKADVQASNGVIHVIDRVILPSDKTIVQTAVEAGSFKTLAALLTEAGLVETLSGKGPFTVFAPTDDAFAKLGTETLESLKKDKARLKSILTYHVVPGRIFSDQAIKAGKATSVQGSPITITGAGGKVLVNNARATAADLDASNGVIHVIDTVIMPTGN